MPAPRSVFSSCGIFQEFGFFLTHLSTMSHVLIFGVVVFCLILGTTDMSGTCEMGEN